jgi:hypothetical protein
MKKFAGSFYAIAIVGLFGLNQMASGQCPRIETSGTYTVVEGDLITFTASLNGGDRSGLSKYNWSVSAGKLASGQGTSVIKVDTTGTGGQTVTATVEIGGLAPACQHTASVSSDVDAKPKAVKVDEYGEVNEETEMLRLDGFAVQLQNSPGEQGYIIVSAGKKGKNGEARAVIERTRNYLVKMRGVEASRLVTMDGGKTDNPLRQLWIVPVGAAPPEFSAADKKKGPEKP